MPIIQRRRVLIGVDDSRLRAMLATLPESLPDRDREETALRRLGCRVAEREDSDGCPLEVWRAPN